MNEILLNTINDHYDDGSCSKDNIPGGEGGGVGLQYKRIRMLVA